MILRQAGLTQLETVFIGAAVCCLIAGVTALVVFRKARTRDVSVSGLAFGA